MLATSLISIALITVNFFAPAAAFPELADNQLADYELADYELADIPNDDIVGRLRARQTIVNAGSYTNWKPAGADDSRGPCPALNSLANHNFLPHNGKAITLPILTTAIKEGLNVGADFANLTGGFALKNLFAAPAQSFNLADLNKHNVIEHDGSLSRGDSPDDNHSFNKAAFSEVLKFFEGSTTATLSAASKARFERVRKSKANNKAFVYTAKTALLSYVETVSYLGVLSSPSKMNPPVEFVKIFFEQERLPYAEGWRRPTEESNLKNLLTASVKAKAGLPLDAKFEEAVTIAKGSWDSLFNKKE